MKLKYGIYAVVTIMIVGLLIGQSKTISLQSERIESLMNSQSDYLEEKAAYEETIDENTKAINVLDENYSTLISLLESRILTQSQDYINLLKAEKNIIDINDSDTEGYIHIYGFDDQVTNREVQFYLTEDSLKEYAGREDENVDDESDENEKERIKDELSDVIHLVSDVYFNHLTIKLVSIDETSDGKIAVINLSELDNTDAYDNYYGWSNGYFQGSTGGQYTEDVLVYNFLQPDKATWPIDGIKVLYENENILFEHVPNLESTIMRTNLERSLKMDANGNDSSKDGLAQ